MHLVKYNIIVIKAIERVAHCPLTEALVLLNNPFLLTGPPHDARIEQQSVAHQLLLAVCQPLALRQAKYPTEGHWRPAAWCKHWRTFTLSPSFSRRMFVISKGRFSLWEAFLEESKGPVVVHWKKKGVWLFFFTEKGSELHW